MSGELWCTFTCVRCRRRIVSPTAPLDLTCSSCVASGENVPTERDTLVAELVAALKGVADFDPNRPGRVRWRKEHGWCWCGGSVRHWKACRAARAVIAKAGG